MAAQRQEKHPKHARSLGPVRLHRQHLDVQLPIHHARPPGACHVPLGGVPRPKLGVVDVEWRDTVLAPTRQVLEHGERRDVGSHAAHRAAHRASRSPARSQPAATVLLIGVAARASGRGSRRHNRLPRGETPAAAALAGLYSAGAVALRHTQYCMLATRPNRESGPADAKETPKLTRLFS